MKVELDCTYQLRELIMVAPIVIKLNTTGGGENGGDRMEYLRGILLSTDIMPEILNNIHDVFSARVILEDHDAYIEANISYGEKHAGATLWLMVKEGKIAYEGILVRN